MQEESVIDNQERFLSNKKGLEGKEKFLRAQWNKQTYLSYLV